MSPRLRRFTSGRPVPSAAPGSARPAAAPPAVELRAVRRSYGHGAGAVHALGGVDLVLPKGTFTAVMGPSGSGKSTFLQCAAGLDRPDAGQVLLAGQEISSLGEDRLTKLRRTRIGFVFQSFNLLPSLTVLQNVLLPQRLAGRRQDRARAHELLARVGLGEHASRRPGQLSGGQQQRVALARALVTSPDVIFADEPTGALDTRSAHEVLGLLRDAVDGLGATVVMVTHDPVAASFADRVVFLAGGTLSGELHHPDPRTVADRMLTLSGTPSAAAA
ncbi:ABC transporter ATP-binding protein [Kitasatospora cineracea]|uniref:ABC transport system ATP-binding protein n=1 Tax=Kitasatospora cineracea TaxID=88074 RepID=A0A3N4R384_9ACTN|nr:ABC transporter ATP-binding protein [Kitasatospora cineracea]ROR35550.1 putative ABC transport system ATP-binding protein [Kitasatospora cineracea]RPE27642.1 putative ABC transport system ATP-binding protein [Kitasatospora cineracea]